MSAHLAWRILGTNVPSSGYTSWAEVDLFAGNRLLKSGTAFASSSDLSGSYLGINAFDLNYDTLGSNGIGAIWVSAINDANASVGIILPKPEEITSFVLHSRGRTTSPNGSETAPQNFKLQYSDNTTTGLDGDWYDAEIITGESLWGNLESRSYSVNYNHTGWRVFVETNNGGTAIQLNEVFFRENGIDIGLGVGTGLAFASSEKALSPATGAFNGDLTETANNNWASNFITTNEYVGKILNTAAKVSRVDLACLDNAVGPDRVPQIFRVEWSDDSTTGTDGTWVVASRTIGQTGWVAAEIREFNIPFSFVALRIIVDAINGGVHTSLIELIINDILNNNVVGLSSGGTAFSSSNQNGATLPAKAFDDVITGDGYWGSALFSSIGEFLGKILGNVIPAGLLDNLTVISRSNASAASTDTPVDFRLQGSGDTSTGSDGTWLDLAKITSSTWVSNKTQNFLLTIPTYALSNIFKGSNLELSNSNLTAKNDNAAWALVRLLEGRSTGKFYFEVKHRGSTNADLSAGLGTDQVNLNDYVGADANAWGFTGDGFKTNNGLTDISLPIVTDEVVGFYVDLDAGELGIITNAGDFGLIFSSGVTGTLFPMVAARNGEIIDINLGLSEVFTHLMPYNYSSWDLSQAFRVIFSPSNTDVAITLSNNNLTASTATSAWRSTYAQYRHTTGKWYFEITLDAGTLVSGIGLLNIETHHIANFTDGVGYISSSGNVTKSGSVLETVGSVSPGDAIGVLYDGDNNTVQFVNNNLETSTVIPVTPGNYYAGMGLYNPGTGTANFGESSFVIGLPFGYSSWNESQVNDAVTYDPLKTGTNISLSNNNLTAVANSATWNSALSNKSVTTGKYYAEITIDGVVNVIIGITDNVATATAQIGTTTNSIGYRNNGVLEGNLTDTGLTPPTFVIGDVIGLLFDGDNNELSFIKNGELLGVFYNTIPTTNPWFVAVSTHTVPSGVTVNFGATDFIYPLPDGYIAWDGSTDSIAPTLNPIISEGNLINNNLTLVNVNGDWDNAFSSNTKSSGVYYIEVTCDVVASSRFGIGITTDYSIGDWLGNNANGIGFWTISGIYHNNTQQTVNSNLSLVTGSVIGITWNADTGTLNAYDNNGTFRFSYTDATKINVPVYFVISSKLNQRLTVNFGGSAFTHTQPAKTSSWDSSKVILSDSFNPLTKPASFVLSNGNLTAINNVSSWNSVVSIDFKNSGKVYLELLIDDPNQNMVIGIAQSSDLAAIPTQRTGFTTNSYGYSIFSGDFFHNSSNVSGVLNNSHGIGLIVGILLDLDNNTIQFIVRGLIYEDKIAIDSGVDYYFVLSTFNKAQGTVNFGATPFTHEIQQGFISWDGLQSASAIIHRLDPLRTDQTLTLSNNDLTIDFTGAWKSSLVSVAYNSGKHYFEVTIGASGTNCGVGFATNDPIVSGNHLGSPSTGYMYNKNDGLLFNNGSGSAYGSSYANNDVIGILLDLDNNTAEFTVNDVFQGQASIAAGLYFAGVSTSTCGATINLGGSAFQYELPYLYSSWDESQVNNTVTIDPRNVGNNIVLSNGNLTVSNSANVWNSAVSVNSYSSGKHYFETTLDGGIEQGIGILATVNPTTLNLELGNNADGYMYNISTGTVRNNSSVLTTLSSSTALDIIGIGVDLDSNQLLFWKNGTYLGIVSISAGTYYATVSSHSNTQTLNFGATVFNQALPAGYTSWDGNSTNNAVTFDAITKATQITLSNSDLTSAGNSATWGIVRVTSSKLIRKYYAEFTVDSTASNDTIVGIVQPSTVLAGQFLGQGATAYGYYATNGAKTNNGAFATAYGSTYTVGDVISVLFDGDNNELSFWKNGVDQGIAFTGLTAVDFYLAASHKTGNSATINTGASAFVYKRPINYASWDESQLSIITLDPQNKSVEITLSNNDLTFAGATSNQHMVKSENSHESGIYYFETTMDIINSSSEIRVGLALTSANIEGGVGNVGSDSWSFQSNGFKFFNNVFTAENPSIAVNDVLGVIADLDAKTISIIRPGSTTTLLYSGLGAGAVFAAWSSRHNNTATANLGNSAFAYTMPANSKSWDDQQLSPDLYDGYSAYRLFIVDNNGDTIVQVAELDLLLEAGNIVSQNPTGTAYASSINGAGSEETLAFDGISNNGAGNTWASATSQNTNQYVGKVFSGLVKVNHFTVYALNNAVGIPRAPRTFKLQATNDTITNQTTFDNANWIDVSDTFVEEGWSAGESRTFLVNNTESSSQILSIITIVATDDTATEAGTTTGEFTITSDTAAPAGGLIINLSVTGTATDSNDYVTISNTATILQGNTSVNVTVTPVDDFDVEIDETVIITVQSSVDYSIGNPSSAIVTIQSDDVGAIVATISATDNIATELGSTTGDFTVTLDNPAGVGGLTVNFAVSGTATETDDYVSIGSSVIFAQGETSKIVTITPVDDVEFEPDETVIVTLQSGTGYTIGASSSDTVTIQSDEAVAPIVSIVATDALAVEENLSTGYFTVSLDSILSYDLTVQYTVSGTATDGTDYSSIGNSVTITAGQTSENIIITPISDGLTEVPAETVIITLDSTGYYNIGTASDTVTISDTLDDVVEHNYGSLVPSVNPNYTNRFLHENVSGEPKLYTLKIRLSNDLNNLTDIISYLSNSAGYSTSNESNIYPISILVVTDSFTNYLFNSKYSSWKFSANSGEVVNFTIEGTDVSINIYEIGDLNNPVFTQDTNNGSNPVNEDVSFTIVTTGEHIIEVYNKHTSGEDITINYVSVT